jgi:hypothetical protein
MNRFFTDHLAFEILRYFPDVDTDNHFNGIGIHGVFDSKFERIIITKLDYIPINKNIKYDATKKEFYLETIIPQIPTTTSTTTIPGSTTTSTTTSGGTTSTTTTMMPLIHREVVYLEDTQYFCNKSWTLSYNLNTRSWISFHSYIPNWYIAENNFFYSGSNDCCTDFEAVVAVPVPEPSTTTTTSSTSSTSTSTTTSTSTSTTTSTTTCACPEGFNVLPNDEGCQKITSVPPVVEPTLVPGDGFPSEVYGSLGVRIYNVGDYNLQGNSISSTYAYTNPSSFWNSRMNNAIIWESGNACWPGSVGGVSCLPVGENVPPYPGTLGMCDTILLEDTKIYYIGVAGDNGITIKVNGTTIISQNITAPPPTLNFNYWHVYPVVLNAGTNVIELLNTNISDIGGFSAEIYDNTLSELIAATNVGMLNIVFSTENYRTGGPNEGQGFCTNFTCPEGYAYDVDSELCVLIETLPCGGTTTTTSTSTSTTSTTTSTTTLPPEESNTIFTYFDIF